MKNFDISFLNTEIKLLAGTDEAGRGPLAGPVVAAAVVFDNDTYIEGIKDSKLLKEGKREELYKIIVSEALAWSVCAVSHREIDRINILQASLQAMYSAVKKLKVQPDIILVDGNKTFNYSVPAVPVIGGDNLSFSVAAASIIAKVTRDRIMKRLDGKFPAYHWKKNKGYATEEHIRAIMQYGPCSLHRKSFLGKILQKESGYGILFNS